MASKLKLDTLPLFIVLYIRVSTQRQVEQGDSEEFQRAAAETWAKANGHMITKVYVEDGSSAFRDRRTVFPRMIEDIMEGRVKCTGVLVYSFSRFSRNNRIRQNIEHKLSKRGVKVYSITEPTSSDNSNMEFMMKNFIGIFNEALSRQNSQQVTDAMNTNAKHGFFCGSRPPYGYKIFVTDIPARSGFKKRLTIHPDEAEIVKMIFNLSEKGKSGKPWGVKRITTYLNNEGILRRGKSWTTNEISKILTNTAYIGTYKWGVRRVDTHSHLPPVKMEVPAIISHAQFKKVKKGLKTRRVVNSNGSINQNALANKAMRSPHLLTGLLKCSQCGSNLVISLGTSSTGRKYRYYSCRKKIKEDAKTCSCPHIPSESAERAVISVISDRFRDSNSVDALIRGLQKKLKEKSTQFVRKKNTLARKLSKVESSLQLLYEALGANELTLDNVLHNTIENKQREISSLTEQIDELKSQIAPSFLKHGRKHTEEFCRAFLKVMLSNDKERCKAYLSAVVSEILVNPQKLKVTGKRLQLAQVISEWKPGTLSPRVPSTVSNWRARRDSNSRPIGSKPTTLSS